jgi:Ca2+-binding RTX toxin-like protein
LPNDGPLIKVRGDEPLEEIMRTLVLAVTALALACKSSGTSSSTNRAPAPAGAATQGASPSGDKSALAADYYPYSKPGTASIDGQAFVIVRGGDVLLDNQGYLTTISDNTRTAAGNDVTLDPATSFAMDWYMKSGTSLRRFTSAPKDPAFRAARKTAVVDEAGRFKFTGLAAGRYIIRTTITWQTPRDSYRTMTQGGVASAVIDLAEGEQKTVIIKHVSAQP